MAEFEGQEEAPAILPGTEWCSGGNAWLLERARAAGLDPRDYYGEKAAQLYTPFERAYVACFRGKLDVATATLDAAGDGARAARDGRGQERLDAAARGGVPRPRRPRRARPVPFDFSWFLFPPRNLTILKVIDLIHQAGDSLGFMHRTGHD